jgi:hypothetical protein
LAKQNKKINHQKNVWQKNKAKNKRQKKLNLKNKKNKIDKNTWQKKLGWQKIKQS